MREATDTRSGPSDGNAAELGPVDYLVIEFPAARRTGEGLHHVVDLVDRGLIRILDLIFLRQNTDGTTTEIALTDLDGDGGLDLAGLPGRVVRDRRGGRPGRGGHRARARLLSGARRV